MGVTQHIHSMGPLRTGWESQAGRSGHERASKESSPQEQPSKAWEKIIEKSEPDSFQDCTLREQKSNGCKVKQGWFHLDVWKTIFL